MSYSNPSHRGGSRTAATSKMELFVIITKCSILDVAAVQDPPLIVCCNFWNSDAVFAFYRQNKTCSLLTETLETCYLTSCRVQILQKHPQKLWRLSRSTLHVWEQTLETFENFIPQDALKLNFWRLCTLNEQSQYQLLFKDCGCAINFST